MLYRFNLREDANIVTDDEGADLPDIAAAKAYAIVAARSIIAGDVLCGTLALSHSIEVTSEDGSHLMIVRFTDAVTIEGPSIT